MDRAPHDPVPDRRLAPHRAVALAAAASVALALAGCASVTPPGAGAPRDAGPARCDALVRAVDRAVDAAGVRDAQHAPHPASPWLRVDRFTASFAASFASAPLDAEALGAWLARMRDADARSREVEVGNLPDTDLAGLAGLASPPTSQRPRPHPWSVPAPRHPATP